MTRHTPLPQAPKHLEATASSLAMRRRLDCRRYIDQGDIPMHMVDRSTSMCLVAVYRATFLSNSCRFKKLAWLHKTICSLRGFCGQRRSVTQPVHELTCAHIQYQVPVATRDDQPGKRCDRLHTTIYILLMSCRQMSSLVTSTNDACSTDYRPFTASSSRQYTISNAIRLTCLTGSVIVSISGATEGLCAH